MMIIIKLMVTVTEYGFRLVQKCVKML